MGSIEKINPDVLDWYRQKDDVIFDVVPHSHLDYAWYRDRESSKMREVEAFVETLKVQNFTLEQMITIKEFIEGGGKQLEQELRDMIGNDHMELISMYSQPDYFLSPDELRFWNYHFGNNIVRQLGAEVTPFEYLPDSFGGNEETPKILAHAGKNAIVTFRGDEFNYPFSWWESKDGSRILKVLMQGGYANASGLTYPGAEADETKPEAYRAKQVGMATMRIYELMQKYGERYMAVDMPHMLVMNGNDFTKPDMTLPDVLVGVQQQIREETGIENFQIRTSTLGKYVDLAMKTINPEKLTTFRGEMRTGREHYVLRGIDSARMYLKQRMHQVETRIYEAGATASLLLLARNAGLVPDNSHASWQQTAGYYRAIEQILPVGSHDTISGCGSDDAYPLPLSLMTGSYNSANQTARNSMAALANRHDTYGPWQHQEHAQTFANLLPHDRTVLVEVPMQGDLEHDRGLEAVVTYPNGSKVIYPAQVIRKVDTRYALCAVPMTGMSSVQVELRPFDGKRFESYEPDTSMFETDRYSVTVLPNGTLDIIDKRTGTMMKGLSFEDQGDRGDEYMFCPIDGDEVRSTNDGEAKVTVINDGPLFTEVQIDTYLDIPTGLDGDEDDERIREVETRSTNVVRVPISTRMRLFKNEDVDRIEFATTVDNKACDHRLRVLFDAPNAVTTVRAKEPYGFTSREAVPIKGGEGWMEPLPIATSHHQGLLTAGDLALFSRGLQEYEALHDGNGTINQVALTLHRSVGFLSRGNLATRPGWAGPGSATPEAQMIGKYTFEYAVNMNGQQSDADMAVARRDYIHQAEQGFGGANINGLLNVRSSHHIDQTALFPTEDGQAVVLRLDNPNGEAVKIDLSGVFGSAVKCEFDGTVPAGESVDMHQFELAPYAMVSVRLS